MFQKGQNNGGFSSEIEQTDRTDRGNVDRTCSPARAKGILGNVGHKFISIFFIFFCFFFFQMRSINLLSEGRASCVGGGGRHSAMSQVILLTTLTADYAGSER